jgi:hypothetical protein
MGINFVEGYWSSPFDYRDYISKAVIATDSPVERVFSWRRKEIRIIDQGPFGICVGAAAAKIKEIQEANERDLPEGGFSPVYLYEKAKEKDGEPDVEGTYPRVMLQAMVDSGALPEKDLPQTLLTDITKLPVITPEMDEKAKAFKIKPNYARVPVEDLTALKQAIKNSPVMAGVMVCSSFVDAKGGYIPSPSGYILGGHGIAYIGWNDNLVYTYPDGHMEQGFVEFTNSWGPEWGDKGHGWIPYSLLKWQTSNLGMPFVMEQWLMFDVVSRVKYWKVQVGAFSVKSNAERRVGQLKLLGYPTYLPPVGSDGLYRIQVGAFEEEFRAGNLKLSLIANGFKDAFIVYGY